MKKLFTLTVPDVLWINLQVTGEPQSYSYSTLEEGTFYQFQNGQSTDFARQATRFLTGFYGLAPFSKGNEATAFVGTLAFLEMNGKSLNLSDDEAGDWLTAFWSRGQSASDTLSEFMIDHESHLKFGVPKSSEIVESIVGRYPKTIGALKSL